MRAHHPETHRGPIGRLAGCLLCGLLLGTGGLWLVRASDGWANPDAPAKPAATPSGGAPASGTDAAKASPAAAGQVTTAVKRAAGPKPGVQSMAAREERVAYHYNALGRRDPFKPLIGGFIGADMGGDAPPDVGGIRVVGIVWGAKEKFALVEDPRGNSLVLRRGDKVMNGTVESLKRDAVIVKLTLEGQTEWVTIPLTRKGDESNEMH